MQFNLAQFNAVPFNQGEVPAAAAAPPDYAPVLGVPYRFEVYTRAGAYLSRVAEWRGGERGEAINEIGSLRLEVASSDESADDLVFPNEIWMWIGESSTVAQKYKILTRRERRDADGHWITVECESLIGDLARELVSVLATPVTQDEETGEFTREKQSIQYLIGQLLGNFQTQTPSIRRGHIDSSIGSVEIAIRLENKSILACLFDLQQIVGGYFYVDTSRRLNWKRSIGYELGHWLRLDHNMTEIEVFKDYRQIKTRMVGRGAGFSNDTRLESTQDDSAAQSTYGVIVGRLDSKQIDDQDTLDEVTEAELARWASPATSYRMGVVDLSQIDPDAYSFEAIMLTPGTTVNVICDAPVVDFDTRVRSVKWDLVDPSRVQVEFTDPDSGKDEWGGNDGTKEPDLIDQIAALMKTAQDAVSDTGIGSAVARSMSPATEDITDILTIDNAPGRLADLLEIPYTTEGNEDADAFADAMLQRLIDALGNSNHPLNTALRAAVGTGEDDVWVPYAGS